MDYVINVLTGKLNPQIKMYRHEELDIFGIGKDKDEHFWNSLLRQMLLEKIIEKDIVEYGLLKFTKKGEALLKKPASFKIALNNTFEEAVGDDDEGQSGDIVTGAADETLLLMLKDVRKQVAKEKNLPPFVIFFRNKFRGYGHSISYYFRRTGKMPGCK